MATRVNDFTINIATANGTGSQSANLIILHSMYEMGVPVSGKNLFPSNISGLPTWFIIRASDAGYQAPGRASPATGPGLTKTGTPGSGSRAKDVRPIEND